METKEKHSNSRRETGEGDFEFSEEQPKTKLQTTLKMVEIPLTQLDVAARTGESE